MKLLKKILGIFILIYVLVNIFLYFSQESLIFIDTKLREDYVFTFQEPFDEINLTTADRANIHALHFKHEQAKGALVYYHGNAGDLSKWAKLVLPFYQMGYDIYIMDYRNYGKSKGDRSEEKMYLDAHLFYEKVREDFSENEITVYGRSLGSTFAVSVAANYQPNQLLLETPFYSLESIVYSNYWFLPVKQVLKYRFPTNEFIDQVNCPITIIQGTRDRVVPYKNAKRLLEVKPNIAWVTIEGGRHNNLAKFEEYWLTIKKRLN